MFENNKESHYHGNVPMMSSLRKRLVALRPINEAPSTSITRENPTPTGANIT